MSQTASPADQGDEDVSMGGEPSVPIVAAIFVGGLFGVVLVWAVFGGI